MGNDNSSGNDHSSDNNNNDNHSSDNNNNDRNCDHGWNRDNMRYEHSPNDNMEQTHTKNEVNNALDRVESFSPSGIGQMDSAVQSFIDGRTLTNGADKIAENCNDCNK